MSDFEAGVFVGVIVGTVASFVSYAITVWIMRRLIAAGGDRC